MALEIFLDLLGRQRERGNPVGESYAKLVQTYNNLFVLYGYPHLAENLPEVPSESPVDETKEMDITATGSFQPPVPGPRFR